MLLALKMVLLNRDVAPPPRLTMPPPTPEAEFWLRVLLRTSSVALPPQASLRMPPPRRGRVAAESAVKDLQRRVAGITVVVDAAAVGSGCVAAEGAVEDLHGRAARLTVVKDAAAIVGGRVAADRAPNDFQRRAAPPGVVEDATAGSSRVASEATVGHEQASMVIIDAAAVDGRVAADRAVEQFQASVVVIDAAAVTVDRAVDDGQANDVSGFARSNVKHPAGMVATNGQHIGTGSENKDVVVHRQFASCERDRLAVERRIEVDQVPVVASARAWRNEPAPLSLVFVTVMDCSHASPILLPLLSS